jgi:hypothetical protein
LLEIYSGKPLNLSASKPFFNQQASSEVNILACGKILGASIKDPAGIINEEPLLLINLR